MPAKKRASVRSSAADKSPVADLPAGSDMAKVDAHLIRPEEYDELPELTDEMFARARFSKGGRPISTNPRVLISLRLPADVLEKWRATGPGWQTRMAERLSVISVNG